MFQNTTRNLVNFGFEPGHPKEQFIRRSGRYPEFQSLQNVNFCDNDLLNGVGIRSDIGEFFDFGRVDFFVFRGDEHGSNSHKL